jgi:AcrR family transcriptional regulator
VAAPLESTPARRAPLSRARVLDVAMAYADTHGIDALSMRSLAQELSVVPMALYKHVGGKEDLLDGMIEVVVGEIVHEPATGAWKRDARERILAARSTLQRHQWSRAVLESRPAMTPAMLDYLDALTGLFIDGGLSVDLTHHVMHALGNRMWGFSQELFAATPPSDTASFNAQRDALPRQHPHLAQIARAAAHAGPDGVLVLGCDDAFEFEFALDIVLDGAEKLHALNWTSG